MSTTEDRVRELEIAQARQEVVVDGLKEVVSENTTAIKELTAVLNKGKGAAWMMAGTYTVLGGAIATFIAWVKG